VTCVVLLRIHNDDIMGLMVLMEGALKRFGEFIGSSIKNWSKTALAGCLGHD
jgi:hypothetical protein